MSPYIQADLRRELEPELTKLICLARGRSAGELNFIISRLIAEWAESPQPSYHGYNSALGVLEAVKLELYRRRIGPYEDHKCVENGDVYE